jgi:protein-disulfide isomerase
MVIACVGFAGAAQAEMKPDTADLVYGKADAPVTIVEYAALTCPHCAQFHAEVLPELKKRYIDTGAVKLVFRDFPFEGLGLRAHMLARCAGPERRVGFMDVLFKQQKTWASAGDPIKALQQVAKVGGIGEADFQACMTNKAVEEAVLKNRMEGEQKDKVTSTPTLFVNGQRFTANRTVEEFAKVLDPLLKDWKPKSG